VFFELGVYLETVTRTVKATLMLCAVLFTHADPLITIGDAVASFLENEDPSTRNICLLSLKDFRGKRYQAGSRVWNNDSFR
jgi:hypothetical protein